MRYFRLLFTPSPTHSYRRGAEITGSHWNGYDFFQMGKKRVAKRKKGGNG
jgi:hypothetical protein